MEGTPGSQSVGQQSSWAAESVNYADNCPSLHISMSRQLKLTWGTPKEPPYPWWFCLISLVLIHGNVKVCPKEFLLMTLSASFSAVICTHQNHKISVRKAALLEKTPSLVEFKFNYLPFRKTLGVSQVHWLPPVCLKRPNCSAEGSENRRTKLSRMENMTV